jgi:lipoate---protein ligase
LIGRNQNAWKECKISELESDGGYLVRRLSGGGAVFHDLGNLNFTFLVRKPHYDLDKQLEVIIHSLQSMGIPVEKSGRNDITVQGRKFSGNAYYSNGNHCYHHGTLLLHVDMENLSKYLNVSREKLQSKGVRSVKSRVTNLISYKEDLTVQRMIEALIQSFATVYDCKPMEMKIDEIDLKEREALTKKFSSWDWIYGNKIPFTYNIEKRFSWGNVDIQLGTYKGRIEQCRVYSDAMDIYLADQLPKVLVNCPFKSKDMVKAINEIPIEDEEINNMIQDISSLILNENL